MRASSVTRILVTGSNGFIGRNLLAHLSLQQDAIVEGVDVQDDPGRMVQLLKTTDLVYHLAGVNRPEREGEFFAGNAGLTGKIVEVLSAREVKPPLVFSSSIQAEVENPYGQSKRLAEEALSKYGEAGGTAIIYRLPNVFGKWSRPNYNSAVATFCYNIAHGIPISVSDPNKLLELVYIDDVVHSFLSERERLERGTHWRSVSPTSKITLGDLVHEIGLLRDMRQSCVVPDLSDPFRRALLATYDSFLPEDDFAYSLKTNEDSRGILAEFVKAKQAGQIFVSRTKPGITRGNHYHHTKVEKFCVLEGDAMIRFRSIGGGDVLSYKVAGSELKVVDIPPGYTHSIENVGQSDLITLFWSSELFNKENPDTYPLQVQLP
jgi:UDP-2-acetamido-2,6-beta-L-arabino-hexul-4-ose reductase